MRAAAAAALAAAVLAGCGDGGADEPTANVDDATPVVAALGDSITAGSPLWDPDPTVREGIAEPDPQSQFEYWAAREPGTEAEFRNCGVFGERTDEIALRLDDCAEGANALVLQGGINDIAQGRRVDEAADDLRSMVRRGKELGLEVTLVDVLPWNNGHPAADKPIAELNRAIRQIANEEDVEVVGFHDALEDREAPGTMRAELTIEGDHPSVPGYRILGRLVARAVSTSRRVEG